VKIDSNDALLIVDVQEDFLPGGALGVPDGDAIVPVLNAYIRKFRQRGLPVIASRDWHPPDHCSFMENGGPWPPHCLQDQPGAEFAAGLDLPEETLIVSKATDTGHDAYSAFDGTALDAALNEQHIRRLFIGGLATDYCVRRTASDALGLGYRVQLLMDAIRAIDPAEGGRAIEELQDEGADVIVLETVSGE